MSSWVEGTRLQGRCARKKFEPAWDALIRSRRMVRAMPMLERTLAAFGGR